MKKILCSALLCLFSIGNGYASNSSVDKMFETMQMDSQLNGGFEAMLPVIDQMSGQLKLDAAAKEELTNIYRTWFNEDIDRTAVIDKIKQLYAQSFTEKEIQQVTKFYQTPVGQKFLQKSPELMKLGAQIGMAEAQSKQAQLLSRLKPFFKKHNIE
ncbi:DUF2059 domain-containing protein [Catenovulum sediminis]|uniref:DUF2059 domain-containing protein n=1 Tax=Catenovulum sediminis TaxID=1740262 RepID=UPI00117D8FD1|nr:DUF2059 domain-containing protein [Catenovulum sediminis]